MFLPPLAEVLENSRVVALPLVANFRGIHRRTALVFEGPSGWAEFAPFSSHDTAHAARWLEAAFEQAYGEWPTTALQQVPVNGILPEVSVADSALFAQRLFEDFGIEIIKFKSSDSFADDLAKIKTISERISTAGGAPQIRLDVNGNWGLAQAVANMKILKAEVPNLHYVEQPVSEMADLARLKTESDVPIALDETLRLAEKGSHDFAAINAIADYVILKALPLGGVNAALALAKNISAPIVVSGSLDTSVGLAAGVQLAALLPSAAAGLATDLLFAKHISTTPHQISNGAIAVGRVTPDLIPQNLATETETEELKTRLAAAYEYLATATNLETA